MQNCGSKLLTVVTILICIFSLFRLEWVESFKIVDKNEECHARHLEIVCRFGEVPCTADIVEFFGEDILPFITYQKGKHFLLLYKCNDLDDLPSSLTGEEPHFNSLWGFFCFEIRIITFFYQARSVNGLKQKYLTKIGT